jgi:hypothetical protein
VWLLEFQRITVPLSSGSASPARGLLDPEDEGTMTLCNIRNYLLKDIIIIITLQEPESSPTRKQQLQVSQ